MKGVDDIPIAPMLLNDSKDEFSEGNPNKPISKWQQLVDSLEDKSWGKRYKAFDDLNVALNEEDPNLIELVSDKWVIYLSEANMKVQEKMCNAFNNFIEKKKIFSKESIIELVQVLIYRCISSNLEPIKIVGLNASVKLADKLQDVNPVIQVAVENIENLKKCQIASVLLINTLITACGTPKVNIKALFPMFESLLKAPTNPFLKKEIINFYKIAYQQLGSAMLSYLNTLPTSLLEEVNKAISTIAYSVDATAVINNKIVEGSMCDSVWCDKYNSFVGWKEKKAFLEESISKLTQASKIRPPLSKSFLELVKKSLESEPCLAVVQLVIKLLSIIGEILKEEMNGWKVFVIQLLLKYKEKKLEEDITNCFMHMKSVKIGQITNQICDIITKDKQKVNPNVKRCVALWIGKSVISEAPSLKNTEIIQLSEIMIGLADDGLPEVREQALKTLGVIKATSKVKIDMLINDLSPSKKEIIIKAMTDTIQIKVFSPSPTRKTESQFTTPKDSPFEKIDYGSCELMVEQVIDSSVIKELNSQNIQAQLEGMRKYANTIQLKIKSSSNLSIPYYESFIIYAIQVAERNNNNKLIVNSIECINIIIKAIDVTDKIDVALLSFLVPLRSSELDHLIDDTIMVLTDVHSPDKIINILLSVSSKSPSLIRRSDVLSISYLLLNEYPIKLFPVKALIDISKKSLYGDNELLAMHLLTKIYSYIGSPLLGYFYDLNEAQLSKLQSNFQNVEIHSNFVLKRILRGDAAKQNSVYLMNIVDKVLPRVDIVTKVTPYMDSLHSPLSKIKLDALGKIKVIVLEACLRINCANLVDLFKGISSCLNDTDDNVKITGLITIGLLIKSVGPKIKIYSIQILSTLICTLACNNKAVTKETHKCLSLYSEIAGGDSVINHLSTTLLKGCKELRKEALVWLSQEKKGYISCEHKLLIPGILSCLQDSSEEVRKMAETLMPKIIPYVGKNAFVIAMRDFNASIQEQITAVLNKYSDITSLINSSSDLPHPSEAIPHKDSITFSSELVENIKQITSMLRTSDSARPISGSNDSAPKIPLAMLSNSNESPSGDDEISPAFQKEMTQSCRLENAKFNLKLVTPKVKIDINSIKANVKSAFPGQKSERGVHSLNNNKNRFPGHSNSFTFKSRPSSYASVNLASDEEIRSTLYYKCYIPIVMTVKDKESRLENQRSIWPMLESKNVYVELLKKELKPIINVNLYRDMFSSDFKVHINCINAINTAIKSEYTEICTILDLILRWFSSGFIDNNTGVNKSIVDFLCNLLISLKDNQYLLYDIEIELIVPLAIKLMSTTNSYIKIKAREIIFGVTYLADTQFITPYLIRVLKQKNSKSKVECIEIVKELLQRKGSSIISDKDANLMALSLTTKEVTLKFTILNAINEIYNCEEKKMWERIAPISDTIRKEIEQKCVENSKEVNKSNFSSKINGDEKTPLKTIRSTKLLEENKSPHQYIMVAANLKKKSNTTKSNKIPTTSFSGSSMFKQKNKASLVPTYDITFNKHSPQTST